MTKLAVRLCILTCMLCPDREIVRLYIPKAKRALEEVEGVVFSEKDIRSVNGVIDINYDSYKDAADTPKCKQQYKSLVDYVNEHYHTLKVGTRYAWEEICRECPYRYAFLSDITYRGQSAICDGIFNAISTFEDIGSTYERLTNEGILVAEYRWTCGNIDGSGFYAALKEVYL